MSTHLPFHPSNDAFFAALVKEDDSGVVVRAHIHVEAILLELISIRMRQPEQLPRLTFYQRVALAVALGVLRAEEVPALRTLGDLRNAFGHRHDTELTAERVDRLYGKLSEVLRTTLLDTYKDIPHPGVPSFEVAGPRIRFVTIVITLRMMLLATIEAHLKEEAGGANR